jgi:hypothetical protein
LRRVASNLISGLLKSCTIRFAAFHEVVGVTGHDDAKNCFRAVMDSLQIPDELFIASQLA